MNMPSADHRIRAATADDIEQLLRLWALVFGEDDSAELEPWRNHARDWFAQYVDDHHTARFPVIEVDGSIAATAIGTLELGVPNPKCPQGRAVRLANVITSPSHRRNGYATLLVHDVIEWARSIDADRVDLSATPSGQPVYDKVGFVVTSAPRMKLVLRPS